MGLSEPLGAGEWEKHGGEIKLMKHPGGRTSVLYFSPDGHKFRSWKQCLIWIGEQLPVNLGNRISSGSKRPGSDDDLESPPLKKKQKKSNGISSQKQDTDAVHVSSFPAETPTDGGRKKSKPKKTQKNSDGSLSPRRSRDAGDGSSSSEEGLTDGGRKKSKLKNEQRNSDGGRPQGRGGDAVELSLFSDEGRTNGGKGNSKRLRKKNSGSALASASGSGSPSSPESKEQRTIDKSLSSSNFTRKATQELVKQYCNPPEEGPTDGGRKKSKPKNDQRNSDGSPPQRRDGDAVELSSFSDEGRTNGGKGNSKRLRKKNSGSGLASGSGSGSPTSPGSKDQRASGTSLSPSTFTREATQELVKQCYNPPASEPAKVGRLLSTSSHENGRGARSVTHQGNLFAHEDHEIISPASLPSKGSSSLASPLRSRGQEKSDVSLEQPLPSGMSNGHSTDYVNPSCKIDKTECSGDDSDGSDFELSSGVSRELKSPAGRLASGIRPKRAAAQKNLKEKDIDLCEEDARILLKRESIAETEETAVSQSNCDLDIGDSIQRDLHDFCIRDYGGRPCPVELYKETDVYVSGVMYPRLEGGGLEKVYDGVRCDNIGPVTDWFLMGYEDCQPLLGVSTDVADYYCQKPAPQYKKFGTEFLKKCKLCLEVYDCFAREGPGLTLDRLLSQLSQSFNKQGPKGSFYSRRFFEGHRMFVVEHLLKLEFFILKKGDADGENRQKEERVLFIDTRVWKELACFGGSVQGQGVGSSSDAISQDERLAWALQEEDDRADVIPSKRAPASKGKYYVKINETEIAVDYPLPAYYKKEEHETDEFLLNNDDDVWDPKDLPMRKLHDWTLYNTDSRLVPLELVPMLEAEADTEVFGSGVVTEEDGGDFCIDGAEGARGGLENGESSSLMLSNDQEMRVSLSAIKEWKVELGYSGDFISLRTERAWYRLGAPSRQYLNWYQPVVKTAGLAREIITMLTAEHRINRLSFKDVIKRLSEQSKEQPTYISGKLAEVERYIVVHGPILWQIFAEYPIESIRRSSFISGLSKLMEQVSHTKLSWSKKFSKGSSKRSSNLNPCAKISPDSTKRKPMRATTTRLVDNIWKSYYAGNEDREAGVEKDVEVVELVEDELAEESDDEEPVVEIRSSFRDTPKKKKYWKSSSGDVELDGLLAGRTGSNERVFKKAISRGVEFTVGTAVQVHLDDDAPKEHSPVILLIEYIYETKSEGPKIHGRILQKGAETILGNAANEREVFLTDACEDIEVEKIISKVTVEMRKRNWGHKFRTENAEKDMVDKAAAAEREKKGLAQEYFCRSWYSPERGAFFSIPKDSLSLGNGSCKACEMRRETGARVDVQLLGQNDAFRFEGVTYQVGDYLYVDPYTFNCKVSTSKALHKAGRNKGLRAFTICHLLSICSPKGGKRGAFLMKVRRFYRPEDVDVLKAYRADIHEVYYSEETSLVDMAAARGKCVVRRHAASMKSTADDVLFCNCIYDSKSGALSELPGNIKLSPEVAVGAARRNLEAEEMAAREKGKGKAPEYEAPHERLTEPTLSTLDIFAGCGGLAEGLHQSGVATTKWALEYDHLASEAFKLNHPTAKVFCNNCNVILRAIMEAGGDLDDCVSTPEADELSRKLDVEMKLSLPKPGEVDFISGGPPCQGFSGMNRFNQRAWSKVQCEMILSFLSYVEYLRPRFFLLENVRNFVSFNKGQTFRLSLMTLLEMGYQVRFGVLQAGNYGVAQSRKRAFIWAVAPDEALPEWPQPRHVFASSQLGITFPGGVQYSAVKDAGRGAPFRPITVRDTIGDLPPVGNGANKEELLYTNHPESWFQKVIRGECVQLVDHISKEMNELNLIRCQRIPKEPGQDWRALPSEKVTLSTGQVVDLIPWCLPNTADRHNQWKGLFGRLDWDGNFPTSVTDPQPMGKVGMCFHPDQDRIVTVRECARSQGFPDYYKFFGNAISKHRQIGNAVPPPLARALGYMLKEAIKRRQQEASS